MLDERSIASMLRATNLVTSFRLNLSRLPLVWARDRLVSAETKAGILVGSLREGMGAGDGQREGGNEERIELHFEIV